MLRNIRWGWCASPDLRAVFARRGGESCEARDALQGSVLRLQNRRTGAEVYEGRVAGWRRVEYGKHSDKFVYLDSVRLSYFGNASETHSNEQFVVRPGFRYIGCMTNITRRLFLRGATGFALAGTGIGSYAFAVEPGLCLEVTSYRVTPQGWPQGLRLEAAVLTDIHACEPWMPAERIAAIAELTNRLAPDIVFLLGDFNGSLRYATTPVMPDAWGEALSALRAPLGVHAVLGNHDWLHGPLPDMPPDNAEGIRRALSRAGSTVLENDALHVTKGGRGFWVAGLGDQIAWTNHSSGRWRSRDDLKATLAKVTDEAPVILLAHEPFIFPRVPSRVSLTLCGHTHGGQVNLPILETFRPTTELTYGHIVENDRHLIVSAGLGTSVVPIRFLRPPEIVKITIEARPAATA